MHCSLPSAAQVPQPAHAPQHPPPPCAHRPLQLRRALARSYSARPACCFCPGVLPRLALRGVGGGADAARVLHPAGGCPGVGGGGCCGRPGPRPGCHLCRAILLHAAWCAATFPSSAAPVSVGRTGGARLGPVLSPRSFRCPTGSPCRRFPRADTWTNNLRVTLGAVPEQRVIADRAFNLRSLTNAVLGHVMPHLHPRRRRHAETCSSAQ